MIPAVPSVLIIIAGALFATGLFGLMAKSHLIKMVMGLEFLGKAVCLLFILSGYLSNDVGMSQAVVFIVIAIEAVIAGVALALIILVNQVAKTFDCAEIARILGGSGP
jgi:NADH-quinone oxidoreductase subunit K